MPVPKEYARRNAILKQLSYRSYRDYLSSETWKSIRNRMLELFPRCSMCESRDSDQVHHLRYSVRVLIGEWMRDLVPLCRRCHEGIEFIENKKSTLGEANRCLVQSGLIGKRKNEWWRFWRVGQTMSRRCGLGKLENATQEVLLSGARFNLEKIRGDSLAMIDQLIRPVRIAKSHGTLHTHLCLLDGRQFFVRREEQRNSFIVYRHLNALGDSLYGSNGSDVCMSIDDARLVIAVTKNRTSKSMRQKKRKSKKTMRENMEATDADLQH